MIVSWKRQNEIVSEWMFSHEGCDLSRDSAEGEYLKNRIRHAFMSGFEAAEKEIESKP